MGLFSGIKNKIFGKGMQRFDADPYTGARPYSASDVGLGAENLKALSDQYRKQIMERSQGQGLVGYDPEYRATLENEFNSDLTDEYNDYTRRLQAQSASQGQRGGIPLDLSIRAAKDFGRRQASGLAQIKIGDLEARRADINSATYAQPELVSQGAGIQQNRANFDLAEYGATQPTYVDDPGLIGPLIGAAATAAGAYFGGPGGASIGSAYNQQRQSTVIPQKPSYNASIYNDPYYRQRMLRY